MTTNIIGDGFRDYVLQILQSRFSDAHGEGKVAWKNSDIVFTMMELGKRIKVAVECKNYNRALNTTDFSTILADYRTALDNGQINLILIIANRSVGAASRQYIENDRYLRFMTVAELESWLVGLEPYVKALVDEFRADEVHEYYIEGRFDKDDGTAFEQVRDWIDSPLPDNTGLAVLGGYGLGKSSLAKRVASFQAQRYLSEPEKHRLPILLPLGQVIHETELAGLFGKHFTARYSLETYSFKTLLQLNSAGRLLIILDGFDEMKHAMTEHDFRSNFREFNKLRVRGAKIMLLGRPNVFTSDSSDLLIRGLSQLAGQIFSNADFPSWTEKRLSFFTFEEQRQFLNGFLKYKSPLLADENVRAARIEEVIKDIDDDILQRPVQTRIVGLLAADPNYLFKGTNRFRLYNDFVRQVIQRDQEKRARSFIPADHRYKFLSRLAWWAWTRPGISQGTFLREDVPSALFEGLSDGLAVDFHSKRTEYLVSSLTEEKDSHFLYFAHRSFHEFLVASYITSLPELTQELFQEIGLALSQDVVEFLNESQEQNFIQMLYEEFDGDKKYSINTKLLGLLGSSKSLVIEILQKPISKISAFDILILSNSTDFKSNKKDYRVWLCEIIVSGVSNAADAAAFVYVETLYDDDVTSYSPSELLSAVWIRMISGWLDYNENFENEPFSAEESPEIFIQDAQYSAIARAVSLWTRKLRLLVGDYILVNFKEFHSMLNQSLNVQGFVGLSVARSLNLAELKYSSLAEYMDKNFSKRFGCIYNRRRDEFVIIKHSGGTPLQPIAKKRRSTGAKK